MGVTLEKERFNGYSEADTLIIWYLDFTGDELRWPQVTDTFCLHADKPNYVGRAVSQEDCPLADPRISRRHAVLEVTSKGLQLTDLGSANGTFVNGERVDGPIILNVDDHVYFDRLPFRIRRSLNLPELSFDDQYAEQNIEQPAGLARRRLLEARKQRLQSEGRLPGTGQESTVEIPAAQQKLRSRYSSYTPVMLGSALAVVVAGIIIYLL